MIALENLLSALDDITGKGVRDDGSFYLELTANDGSTMFAIAGSHPAVLPPDSPDTPELFNHVVRNVLGVYSEYLNEILEVVNRHYCVTPDVVKHYYASSVSAIYYTSHVQVLFLPEAIPELHCEAV